MEIEVHQSGGVLGLDRRYVVKDGTIEVIDRGRSRGWTDLDPSQAARIDALATDAAGTTATREPTAGASDDLVTAIAIVGDGGHKSRLELHSGDDAPAAIWDLIGEVSRACDT